ncbi:hypothetical protein ACFVUY_09960 [Kitasatospora sp. NPDC058063]|uniref:hypothetical protein n=1 Tax=unclassified Kitasatospora TaxID=2633591 RepID=UPI0036DC79E5
MELDRLLPQWDHTERHRIAVPATTDPAVAIAAVEAVRFRDVPVFHAITTVGTLGTKRGQSGRPFLASMLSGGFAVLHRSADELVIGAAVRTTGGSGPADLGDGPGAAFRDFDQDGHYKVAFNFHCAGGELSTETRVLSTDPATRRRFRRYWLMIRLPSGLIRQEWLRAARRGLEPAALTGSQPPESPSLRKDL